MILWKIAWRNLFRHKGKSLMIGTILFIGAFLMTLGNAVIEGAKCGLEENMSNRFAGHLLLVSAKEKREAVLGTGKTLRSIPSYLHVKTILEQQEYIESFLPMLRGIGESLHEEGKPRRMQVFGVNFEDYQRTFLNNVIPVEGRLLKYGERGLLIGEKLREVIYKSQKFWVLPKGEPLNPDYLTPEARKAADNNTLTIKRDLAVLGLSASSFGTDISVSVKGIIRFRHLNGVLAEHLSFMDVESYRECFGHIKAAENLVKLSDKQKAVLETNNIEDDLFSDSNIVEDVDTTVPGYDLKAMQQQTRRTAAELDFDQGAYSIVMVKLHPGISLIEGKTRLSRILEEANAEVKVLTWKQAVGGWAQLASIMQGALGAFVMFIFFVAIIIIINTLSMAVIERLSEIGMMRAIGARRGFISGMFFAETALLSSIFGGMGIIAGVIMVWSLAALNISVTDSETLSLLLGNDTFHPIVNGMSIALGIIQLTVVTLLALLYPIAVAKKITPLDAIVRD